MANVSDDFFHNNSLEIQSNTELNVAITNTLQYDANLN